MQALELKDYVAVLSLFLSIVSLSIIIYKDFFSNGRLEIAIGNIVAIPYDVPLKGEIALNIIIDDLLSSRPSEDAKLLRESIPNLATVVKERNKELLAKALIAHSQHLVEQNQPPIHYVPDIKDLNEYIKKSPILLNLVTPLNVINVGNNSGNLTTLILQVTSDSDNREVWLFICYYEVNLDLFKDPLLPKQNMSLNFLEKMFPGTNIPSKSSMQLNPFFVPMPMTNDSIVNTKSIVPGKYKFQVFGYDSNSVKVAESKIENWSIEDNFYSRLYDGYLYIQNLTVSNIVSNHINNVRKK